MTKQEEMQAKQLERTSESVELVFNKSWFGAEEEIRRICLILDCIDSGIIQFENEDDNSNQSISDSDYR